jgi:hypothetical protein
MSEQCLSFRAPKTLKTFSITEKKAEQWEGLKHCFTAECTFSYRWEMFPQNNIFFTKEEVEIQIRKLFNEASYIAVIA